MVAAGTDHVDKTLVVAHQKLLMAIALDSINHAIIASCCNINQASISMLANSTKAAQQKCDVVSSAGTCTINSGLVKSASAIVDGHLA